MPILTALGRVFLRSIAASFIGAAAVVLAMLGGAIGGGGSGGVSMATFVVLFGAGWSLLPIIRESSVLAIIVGIAWVFLGYWLSQKGQPHVRGWMLVPWFFASCGVIGCFAIKAPRWFPKLDDQEKQSGNNEGDA